ncbi:hypothetical protein EXIGLDRAFT_718466 [Exidia glandulosa HHB12029]|uniref:SnoaL-like domain-containing protein n=1 Tax=Exidia glandulosa HHB12029 TaxID=1314781 RepID=A0A165NWP3_EXIGL|nr:hypothetical protein EXIGLDRAFT_718466 [Exidia glandulosa HHB12029]
MSSQSSNVQLALSMFSAVRAKDIATLEQVWAPNFEWHVLPASLNRPAMVGRETAFGNMKRLASILREGAFLQIEPIEIIDAPASGAVIIHAKAVDTVAMDGKFNFTNEYIFTVYIAEGKIVKLREFTDSAFMQSWGAHLAKMTSAPASA